MKRVPRCLRLPIVRRGSSRTTISPHAHRTRQVVMLTLDLAVRSTSIGGRLAHLAPP